MMFWSISAAHYQYQQMLQICHFLSEHQNNSKNYHISYFTSMTNIMENDFESQDGSFSPRDLSSPGI